MSLTTTVNLGPTLFICACCDEHADLRLLPGEVVTCKTCGEPCSCEGCVAEDDNA